MMRRLALSHNDLYCDTPSFLPTDIMQCHRLRYLNLRWNSLPGFPQAVRSSAGPCQGFVFL